MLPRCYGDVGREARRGEKPWQFCFEVCQNGLYCGSSYCGASNLVTVMSTEEEEWIAANFASGSDHPTTGDIWLGYGYVTPESVGHYMQTPADAGEGVWLWLGWPSAYENWASGTPPSEGCAAMTADGLGGWSAQSCTSSARCLCELSPPTPPAPPAPPPPPPTPPTSTACVDKELKKPCKKKHCQDEAKAKKCKALCGLCDDGAAACEDKKGSSWCGKKTKGSKEKKFCKKGKGKKAKKCELSCGVCVD